MTSVWVLTRDINEYNQDGSYFEKVYAEKPDFVKLTNAGVPQNMVRWVQNGGGRKASEDEWWNLEEVGLL